MTAGLNQMQNQKPFIERSIEASSRLSTRSLGTTSEGLRLGQRRLRTCLGRMPALLPQAAVRGVQLLSLVIVLAVKFSFVAFKLNLMRSGSPGDALVCIQCST